MSAPAAFSNRRAVEVAHSMGLRARNICRDSLAQARELDGKPYTNTYGKSGFYNAETLFRGYMRDIEHERACESRAAADFESRAHGADAIEDEEPGGCTHPRGHSFVFTGTAYGGDDDSYMGEGRSYCEHCGADGDA